MLMTDMPRSTVSFILVDPHDARSGETILPSLDNPKLKIVQRSRQRYEAKSLASGHAIAILLHLLPIAHQESRQRRFSILRGQQ